MLGAGYTLLRLPPELQEGFAAWPDAPSPDRARRGGARRERRAVEQRAASGCRRVVRMRGWAQVGRSASGTVQRRPVGRRGVRLVAGAQAGQLGGAQAARRE